MYLKDKIDELFKIYPISFGDKSKALIKTLAKNGDKIDYKNLSYKILFTNDRFNGINYSKKYGTLYSLLEDLITSEIIIQTLP